MTEFSGVSDLIFKNICWRLQQLDCSLLGNSEDWWLNELLLLPGEHRFQLFEWIFSRLKFAVPKTGTQSHSTEENAKEMLPVISALGLCGKKDKSLILGNASKNDQLKFWKEFVSIMWAKTQILQDASTITDSGEFGTESSESSQSQASIEGEYLRASDLIKSCSYKANMNDLFMDHVTLFAPDVTRDIDSILSSRIQDEDSLQKIQSVAESRQRKTDDVSRQFNELVNRQPKKEFCISEDECLADELNMTSFKEFSGVIDDFMVFFESNLKPVLRSSPQNFGSLGMHFTKLHSKQTLMQELLDNLSSMKSSFDILKKSQATDFEAVSLIQPGSTLDEYCQIMKT